MKFPEHEKLETVQAKSQAIGDFLEWLGEQGRFIATAHSHTPDCRGSDGWRACGYFDGGLQPDPVPIERRLAEYFEINLDKIEKEKQAMLRELHARG